MQTQWQLRLVLGITALSLAAACSSAANDAMEDAGKRDAKRDVAPGGDATRPSDAGPTREPDAASGDASQDQASGDAEAAYDANPGAPSTDYPAPHEPLPQLVNTHHGPVLKHPKVYLVFYPGYPYVNDLQTFATNLTTATYWAGATSQYGVGPIRYGGTITLTDTPPSTIGSVDLGTWVGQELASGQFGTPDPEGIYTIVYPSTTTVTQPNPVLSGLPAVTSCVDFGGYHDNIAVTLTDGGTPTPFAYAVIPTCDTYVDDLTAVMSHEWVEASTDPFLTSAGSFNLTGGPDSAFFTVDADHAIWALLGGGEAGDLCEPEGEAAYITPPDVGYTVQRIWSNELAAKSHDPCGPDPKLAYFNAAPVLDETVTITSSLIGNFVTKGVTIPAGSHKTIEVDLFSDGDTGGPWTVTADDALYKYYGSYGLANTLAFQWDRTQGVNGDRLHLTITVTRESIIDGAHAFVITSTQGARQSVWTGVVKE